MLGALIFTIRSIARRMSSLVLCSASSAFCPVIPIFPHFWDAFNLISLNSNCTQLPKCSGLWPYNWCLVSLKSLQDSVGKHFLLTCWTRIKTFDVSGSRHAIIIVSHASPSFCKLRHGFLHTSYIIIITCISKSSLDSKHSTRHRWLSCLSIWLPCGRSWGQHSGPLKTEEKVLPL